MIFSTKSLLMQDSNRIATRFYRFIKIDYFKQYFKPVETEYTPQVIHSEQPMTRARRFAEGDVNFSRVYPLIPELNENERLELALYAASKVSGMTDSQNFTRNTLDKFQLSQEGKSRVIQDLDEKTKNAVTKALRAQGLK